MYMYYSFIDFKDYICMRLAWFLPKRLVKWCAIRVTANATTGHWRNQVVPELTAMDALKRWDK